ncbi:MAG: class I SAM-dependent methyltransferase [Chlamydiae bacterium]|nr:class I SAM-dependent methyltransferase [Chlamydiota bacterium]
MPSVTPVRESLNRFISLFKPKGLVLDLGCGAARYKDFFPNSITLDINSVLRPHVVGDAHSLPFKNESFDAIVCTEMLEHLFEPWKSVEEMKRVLRGGGDLHIKHSVLLSYSWSSKRFLPIY